MAADLVKFRSGYNEKAQDESIVLLDAGQVLFGLTRKEDGSLFGSIWYDYFDTKYNIIQRVPMGGANAAGSYTAGELFIADKNGHKGDRVVIADIDEATLLLPKHICAEYFAADTPFDITHSPFKAGESRQYGNGFVITNSFEDKQEGWIRLIGEDGSKNTTLELATRDSYSKDHKYNQVVIRQYDGDGSIITDKDELLREAILLGINGETYFPGPVTSARGFIGDLTGHASSATKAQYDWLDNDIAETYFATVEEKISNAAYQLKFANGVGTVLKTIFMPIADAVQAGLITADRDNPQTLTGKKIFDTQSGVQIDAPSGFDYKGIQGSENENSTTIWFSKEDTQGTPVYDDTFTYDSKKHLLKVQNIEGLISNAIADQEDNQIDDHYFCYFETANDEASYTIWGMPDTGTKRDFHATPTGALEKNKIIKIVVPTATEDKAGIITADKNNPQYLAGTKYLQGSFILDDVDGQFIGQYYNKTNPKEGYWKLQGEKTDNSLLLETLTSAATTYGKIVIKQVNNNEEFSQFELANIYGNTGLHSLSITDNGDGLLNTSPYVLYINTTHKGDPNQLYANSVFINNIVNTATTVYFGTMNGDTDALYYINDTDNPNAEKSTLVIKTGSEHQTFFAQLRSLYLDDDLYVGKGILNDGPLIQHGPAHMHDITHNHYFNGKKDDIEMGSWLTVEATNPTNPNEVILTLGNNIVKGETGNGQGFLRLYSPDDNYGQWSFNGQDFTPSHNIYFLNNYDKLTGWQNGIWGKVGKDDYWRVGGGATAASKGYLELSVANNNTESILVRKYADDFENLGDEPDTKYEAALLDENGNTYFPKGLAINKNKSDSGYAGLSLYGDITNAQPIYGIIYRTMNGTNHGYTVDTNNYWATYFNIHSKTSGPYGEGWIFNNGTLDVASIDRLGNAQFNQICLNRRSDSSTQSLKQTHGRISWYSPTYYTWYDYMSEATAGYAPTGATPSKIGNITSWARRSLIEDASGYGWVWESCQNKENDIPVAWLGLSSNDGRLIMHGKEIYYAGSTNTISMIRWIENTANNNGHGIGIGGGGVTIIGSGESADTSNFAKLTINGETAVIPENEILYLLSDSNIFLETNAQSFDARIGLKIDTTGALIPVIAESPYDRGINIGSPTARWFNIYANALRLQGPASNPSSTNGARIEFSYDDGNSRLQPVYISYANNTYKEPYGLKIWGSTGTNYGAWLEVQGAIGTSNTNASSGIGISLYNGPVNGKPTYGLFFGGTSTFGKHGTVQGDWATYFTMNDATNRGWIFQKGSMNVASIGCDGTITASYFSGTTITMSNGWFGNNYLTSNWHGWYATSGNTSSTRYGYIQTQLSNNGMMLFVKEQGGSFAFNSSVNIGSTAAPSYMLHVRGDIYANGGWVRVSGTNGFYFENYGGGWQMTDTDWVRVYNGKSIYTNAGIIRSDKVLGGTWIKGTHDGTFQVRAASTASAGSYFQSWFSGKTLSGAWGIGPLSGSNDLYFAFGTDANYSAGTNTAATIRFGSNGTVWSAVWNDYAEYRKSDEVEPGRVVLEDNNGTCQRTTTRMQSFAGVVSDTFGFTQGETAEAKTPLAVAGRVLVYTYQDRNNYQVGDCVCAAPDGTVDIMTRAEIIQWPDRIVGTVSEIPTYEKWGTGEVAVNNRIWIKVR